LKELGISTEEIACNNALDLRNAFQTDFLIRQPGDPMTIGVALSANF
jgi:hypothetical protein